METLETNITSIGGYDLEFLHSRFLESEDNNKQLLDTLTPKEQLAFKKIWKVYLGEASGEGYWESKNRQRTFIGNWKEGKPHGYGVLLYNDSRWEGEWADGKCEGLMTLYS